MWSFWYSQVSLIILFDRQIIIIAKIYSYIATYTIAIAMKMEKGDLAMHINNHESAMWLLY